MSVCNPALAVSLASFLLVGCDSDATVRFELTDAPPDIESIDQVVVSLDRVEAHVAGDEGGPDRDRDGGAGWRTVTEHAGSFDLMALRNDVRATLGELELPDGKITQIRLFIDEDAENRVQLLNGESCALDLSHAPPTGVKIIHPFKLLDVADSSWIRIVIDFDVADSLDQTGSCGFSLKPVIKIKRVERD